MKKIIILCTWNSCRSQIGEAYLQKFWWNTVEVVSAWTKPKKIHPFTIKVLEEDGIDWSHKESKKIDGFVNQEFDYIITVCDNAKENCPFFPWNGIRIHQWFTDPDNFIWNDEEKLIFFRKIRDEIKQYCYDFIKSLN